MQIRKLFSAISYIRTQYHILSHSKIKSIFLTWRIGFRKEEYVCSKKYPWRVNLSLLNTMWNANGHLIRNKQYFEGLSWLKPCFIKPYNIYKVPFSLSPCILYKMRRHCTHDETPYFCQKLRIRGTTS